MRLDSSGNLGLGVTPSASQIPQLQISRGAFTGDINSSYVSNNWYYNSGDKYIGTNYALQYKQAALTGEHQWYTAPSGTAGNAITFTQAMTLDASGRLMVATTSPQGQITVASNGSSQNGIAYVDTNGAGRTFISGPGVGTGAVGDFGFYDLTATQIASLYTGGSSGKWAWYTNGSERARISSDGTFRVKGAGTAGSTDAFQVAGTAPADAARIDSSGNLLIGRTTAPVTNTAGVGIQNNGLVIAESSQTQGGLWVNRITSDGTAIQFTRDNVIVGSISVTTLLTTYNTTSDYRLKTVVGAVSDSGARIDALQPVEYTWNSNGASTRGFLAHQFQEVYAGSVSGTKDAVDEEGKPVYQSMQASTSEVIADLVAELQSLRARVAALELI
jgi:hypothetical protein